MSIEDIKVRAEELVRQYNPDGLSPFPFGNILKDKQDLKIFIAELPDNISGVIMFETEKTSFSIYINKNKSNTRQYFTIAHELGHYFLHQQEVKDESFVDGENVLDRDGMLYRRDAAASTKLEIEANNFAASLVMPSELVKKAWNKLRDVDDCAHLFSVSVDAMGVRLRRLGLLD